uniref:Uncharacterized protein n=1 Tax=Ditylenchus dipsaci TaxID=166011 RepID=A0A915E598_9BILA
MLKTRGVTGLHRLDIDFDISFGSPIEGRNKGDTLSAYHLLMKLLKQSCVHKPSTASMAMNSVEKDVILLQNYLSPASSTLWLQLVQAKRWNPSDQIFKIDFQDASSRGSLESTIEGLKSTNEGLKSTNEGQKATVEAYKKICGLTPDQALQQANGTVV